MKAVELKELVKMVDKIQRDGDSNIESPQVSTGFRIACRTIKLALKEYYLKKDVDFLDLVDMIYNTDF